MDQDKEAKCLRWCCTIFGLAVFAILVTGTWSFAQSPTTVFQLDGNSANDHLNSCTYTSGDDCDYWNLINTTGVSGTGVGNSMVNTFILGSSTTYSFTGGGSKDSNIIDDWSYSSMGAPNKDTLNAAYAAAYTSGGQFYLIFGSDRLSPNGDANIGIWFFQQNVTTDDSGGFIGAHQNGDLFLISQFTGGGGTSLVSAYEWDTACSKSHYKSPGPGDCADTNLRLLEAADASSTFGITNSANVTATWASYSGGQIASPLFFEGGANLTAIYGSSVPCFASFLVETRSSQATNAVLKDFLLGGFPVCGLKITKTCSTSTAHGTYFEDTWTGTVCNTGAATLTNAVVHDSMSATNPTLSSTTLAPKDSEGDCATYSVSTQTTSSSITNTASANAKSGGTYIYTASCSTNDDCSAGYSCVSSVCEPNAQASCSNSASSTVSIKKHCVVPTKVDMDCTSSGCAVLVPISAQVCNQSTTPCYDSSSPGGNACTTSEDCATGYACVDNVCQFPNCPPLNLTCGPNNYCIGNTQLKNIQVADSPAVLTTSPFTALTPNGFSLNPGDCTGQALTNVACGGPSDPPCPTGYSCDNTTGFCKTPPNPMGTYKPTSYDSSSTGNSGGRFLFKDTISVTSATPVLGSTGPTPITCPDTGASVLACDGVSCPLCPYNECYGSPTLP